MPMHEECGFRRFFVANRASDCGWRAFPTQIALIMMLVALAKNAILVTKYRLMDQA
jgi:hypothetical protein